VKRVLVANRGEIALRIIRACHEEGLEAVAVYSDADRLSPHVRAANRAHPLGPPPAAESYLSIGKLIAAAKQEACDAVHPGYGFLSERAAFSQAVRDAGLTFVGPGPEAMAAMGSKTEARRRMRAAGVAVVPGTVEPQADAQGAARAAQETGYPVLLKAAAGGGGKGMRVVREPQDLPSAFRAAASEALKAFGDGAVYIEKLVERPRHVEVQVLADTQGRTVHVGERECSVQRRHQKLIEEAPAMGVTPDLRDRMGAAAVAAARAVGYVSAGTVEFLLLPSGEFYFLEMNTRIQVEHPVTEMVYGVDLVREQLRIAAGKPLSMPEPLRPSGHAIECRITAEDPFHDFLPASGHLNYVRPPAGPGIRWDGGFESGNDVSVYYDSLLGKLIAWGETRDAALTRMRRALTELVIVGVPTSQAFHLRILDDAEFRRGAVDIEYVSRRGPALLDAPSAPERVRAAAVAVALLVDSLRAVHTPGVAAGSGEWDPWVAAARREGLRE
jgi:acetyl-CoA carboxylase, biotin carboxylase subunit